MTTWHRYEGKVRSLGEVCTPWWICCLQNDLIDKTWKTKSDWKSYAERSVMEAACGTAPYITFFPYNEYKKRGGLLDRKLMLISQNTDDEKEWLFWTLRAYKSVFAFDIQEEKIKEARERLSGAFIYFYTEKFKKEPLCEYINKIKKITSRNIKIRDGIKDVWEERPQVIAANPPYQSDDGGGEGFSAVPLYDKFVNNAISTGADVISMIIPARWYSGGKGLSDFRRQMLKDRHIRILYDYPDTEHCFKGFNIRGGLCLFLRDLSYEGKCIVRNEMSHKKNTLLRYLDSPCGDFFVRYNNALGIIKKVMALNEETMEKRVKSRNPFGIRSNYDQWAQSPDEENTLKLYRSERKKSSPRAVYIKPDTVKKNSIWINKKKVIVSKASPGNDTYPHAVIADPVFADENSCCTETYLLVDFVDDDIQAANLMGYMKTRFFRFMLLMKKNTQNISRVCFSCVPVQDWNKSWNDEILYEKYGITEKESGFIEMMVRS